jgi:hypothetical protein
VDVASNTGDHVLHDARCVELASMGDDVFGEVVATQPAVRTRDLGDSQDVSTSARAARRGGELPSVRAAR